MKPVMQMTEQTKRRMTLVMVEANDRKQAKRTVTKRRIMRFEKLLEFGNVRAS